MGQQEKKSQRAKLDQHLTNTFGGRAVHAGDGSGDPVLRQGGAEGQQQQWDVGKERTARLCLPLPPNRPFHVDVTGRLSRDRVDIIENHVIRVPDDHTQLVAVGRTQREVRHMLSPPLPARAGQACTRAAGLEPSWHCGPLPGFLWLHTAQQSRCHAESLSWGATTPQTTTHSQNRQISGVWGAHPAPLGHRSTERFRQKETSAASAPTSWSNFILEQITQGFVCTSFEYLQGWISQPLSASLHPCPRVSTLSWGKSFPYIHLEFPLLQFVAIISCPFVCTSQKNLDPPSQESH